MRTPRACLLMTLVAWAAVLAYTVALAVGGPGGNSLHDTWLGPAAGLLTVAAGLTAMRLTTGAARREAWLLVVGICCWTAGDVYYLVADALGHEPPVPSPADLGYLAMVPLVAAALFLRARRETRGAGVGVLLDAVLGGVGVTAGLALGLRPALVGADGLSGAGVVTLAYPLSDLLLVALVVAVAAARGPRPGAAWVWMGGGLLTFATADVLYALGEAAGTYVVGSPADALWPIGLLALVTGLLVPEQQGPAEPAQPRGAFALLVPAVATLVAVSVLVTDHWVRVPLTATVLAACALVVAAVRTQLAFRQVVQLHDAGRQARTDSLTGLGNRRALYEHLHRREASRDRMAVLLLDLDRFKEVNDTLGHHVGDRLLQQVGERLRPLLRADDRLTRIGGDEFAMVLARHGSAETFGETSCGASERDVAQVAERLVARLHEPFELDGVRLRIGASVGVACFPEDADDVNGLMQRADVAMYEAKAAGGGVNRYDATTDRHSRERLATVEELRTALTDGQLVAVYQPQCEVATGRVTNLEALVRWEHPTRGLLTPDAFLDPVEKSGLMPELTGRMLDLAVRQCVQWRLDGLEVGVSVNLSAGCLLQDGLPDHVARLLVTQGLPAEALTLELTENTLLADPERCRATLERLAALGVWLSVDDYGTGYCSLSYLRDLPVHELKLDRVFLTDLEVVRNRAIVRSTVELAHALGLRLVAEGVEDEAGLELLRSSGCDLAQGYHLCRPQPAAQVTGWLRERALRSGGLSAEDLISGT